MLKNILALPSLIMGVNGTLFFETQKSVSVHQNYHSRGLYPSKSEAKPCVFVRKMLSIILIFFYCSFSACDYLSKNNSKWISTLYVLYYKALFWHFSFTIVFFLAGVRELREQLRDFCLPWEVWFQRGASLGS